MNARPKTTSVEVLVMNQSHHQCLDLEPFCACKHAVSAWLSKNECILILFIPSKQLHSFFVAYCGRMFFLIEI